MVCMIGGGGRLPSRMPRTKSRPAIEAMTSGGVTPYLLSGNSLLFTRSLSRALVGAHQIREALEQVMRVARPRRSLGMVLHREHRPALELDAAVGAVEQRDMGLRGAFGQGRLIHREAVVHRCDLHLAGGLVLYRMIGAMMTLMHLFGLGADSQAEHLVTQANSKGRRAGADHFLNHRHGVLAGLRGIARAVGEDHAVGLHRQNIFGRS